LVESCTDAGTSPQVAEIFPSLNTGRLAELAVTRDLDLFDGSPWW
jgi:hypothetical protein